MTRFFGLILIICLFTSCAADVVEELDDAMRACQYHLTNDDCDKCLDELDTLSDTDTAEYADFYKAKASAYACKSNFSELTLVGTDLANMDAASFLNSLATFSTSDETSADGDNYTYLDKAIDVIIGSDGKNSPSQTERNDVFGNGNGGDLGMQLLYMLMAQAGKFFAYYGNTDDDGDKGSGSESNTCIYEYTDATTITYLGTGQTGPCTNTNQGHEDLDEGEGVSTAKIYRRMCEGVIYYNNIIDVLSNVTLSENDSLGDLSEVQAALEAVEDVARTAFPTIVDVFDYHDTDTCVDAAEDDFAIIQRFYGIFFETILL